MLFFREGFAVFAERVVLLSYVQFWCLPAAGLMREDLSSFELFLQAVLVESLKLFDALIDAVRLRRFWLLGFLSRFLFFLRRSSRIRQVIKVFIKVVALMSLQLQLSSYNFLEILLVSIFMALLFFFVRTEVHSTLRFFSTSMRF